MVENRHTRLIITSSKVRLTFVFTRQDITAAAGLESVGTGERGGLVLSVMLHVFALPSAPLASGRREGVRLIRRRRRGGHIARGAVSSISITEDGRGRVSAVRSLGVSSKRNPLQLAPRFLLASIPAVDPPGQHRSQRRFVAVDSGTNVARDVAAETVPRDRRTKREERGGTLTSYPTTPGGGGGLYIANSAAMSRRRRRMAQKTAYEISAVPMQMAMTTAAIRSEWLVFSSSHHQAEAVGARPRPRSRSGPSGESVRIIVVAAFGGGVGKKGLDAQGVGWRVRW